MNPESVAHFIAELQPAFEQDDPGVAQKAAETENVRRVRALYEALRQGDVAAFRESLAEDAVLEMDGHPDSPLFGRWEGREAVLEGTARNYGRLEDQRPEVQAVLAQGDQVLVLGKEQGRIRATGREYQIPWLHMFTFREGKVVKVYGMSDSHALIEASREPEERLAYSP